MSLGMRLESLGDLPCLRPYPAVWMPVKSFPVGIQALSVSDGIGTSLGTASHVASDPPADAEGFYENASPNDLRQAAAVAGRS